MMPVANQHDDSVDISDKECSIKFKVLLQIHTTENSFQKHFRLTKVLWNLLFIYKSQTRTSPMDIILPFFLCEPR
jgi:hypothetical protein